MSDGLALTITIGAQEHPGRLPLLPDRWRLSQAYREALGWGPDDTDKPSAAPDHDAVGDVLAAAIGLCWADPGHPLQLEAWVQAGDRRELRAFVLPGDADLALRVLGGDLRRFGARVAAALVSDLGHELADVYRAGGDVRAAVTSSIPRAEEVDAIAENFPDPGAGSTVTTS